MVESAGQAAAGQIGIDWRNVPHDGRWHETAVTGKDTRNGAGRIRIFADGEGGTVWNWTTNESFNFWARNEIELDPIARETRRKKIEAQRKADEEERRKLTAEAATKAAALWKAGQSPEGNPYLDRKGVAAVASLRQINAVTAAQIIGYTPKGKGEALTESLLIAPVKIGERLTSCQLIDGEGRKHFMYGGALRGGFWSTGKLPQGTGDGTTLLLAEGVATALSAAQATGHIAVAALSSGNLRAVAVDLRQRHPTARLIVCSDKGNGEEDARRAAVESGALLAIPEINGDGNDWNDLQAVAGKEEVKRQIEAATAPLLTPSPAEESRLNAKQDSDKQEHEAPLLFDEIDAPEIPPDLLPGWLGDYADAVARQTQTPPAMAVMLALSTVATCAAKRFEVAPKHEGSYSEPLNLWTATALPPASRKTAVISAMTAPLVEWEKSEAKRLAPAIKEDNARRRTLSQRIKKLEKDAASAEDTAQREELLQQIGKVENEMPEELRAPRLWTGDTTPERLQSLLEEQGERMAVLTDEGGIFEVMAGLYNDGRANLDIFLQAHAGKAARIDRQTRTAYLDAPALSFGLAIQPAILADMGSGSKRRFRGNGTLARFLFTVPRSNIGSRNVRATYQVPATVEARYRAGIFDLLAIPPQVVEWREIPRLFTLTPEALDSWQAFAAMIETRQGKDGDLETIQDWSGKLPGAALRIAGNFHLVEHGSNPPAQIEADTIEKALDLCDLLIDHAKAAFAMMEADPATADAKAVFNWIADGRLPRFTKTEAYRKFKGRFTCKPERMDKALRELQTRHIVREATESTAGRPLTVFIVNPLIWGES